jgi:plasmid stabilization system protein ParE
LSAYRFSKLARLDLIDIADYTVDTWGVEQALRYLDSLDACFNRLAKTPQIGRRCDRILAGYAAWSTRGTSSSIEQTATVSSLAGSCTRECFPADI